MPDSAVSLEMVHYSNSFFLLCLLHFSIKISMKSFLLETELSLGNLLKFVVYIGVSFLMSQKPQKCYHYIIMSILENIYLGKYTLDFFYQGMTVLIGNSHIVQSPPLHFQSETFWAET